MEQSKSISKALMKLKIAYQYYFKDMPSDEFIGLISIYKDALSDYNDITIEAAINQIIKTNKYMPSVAEVIEECNKSLCYKSNQIIQRMYDSGYFHINVTDDQAKLNYQKALMFVEKGIVPNWLLNDMKEYEENLLSNQSSKMLEENYDNRQISKL